MLEGDFGHTFGMGTVALSYAFVEKPLTSTYNAVWEVQHDLGKDHNNYE